MGHAKVTAKWALSRGQESGGEKETLGTHYFPIEMFTSYRAKGT